MQRKIVLLPELFVGGKMKSSKYFCIPAGSFSRRLDCTVVSGKITAFATALSEVGSSF